MEGNQAAAPWYTNWKIWGLVGAVSFGVGIFLFGRPYLFPTAVQQQVQIGARRRQKKLVADQVDRSKGRIKAEECSIPLSKALTELDINEVRELLGTCDEASRVNLEFALYSELFNQVTQALTPPPRSRQVEQTLTHLKKSFAALEKIAERTHHELQYEILLFLISIYRITEQASEALDYWEKAINISAESEQLAQATLGNSLKMVSNIFQPLSPTLDDRILNKTPSSQPQLDQLYQRAKSFLLQYAPKVQNYNLNDEDPTPPQLWTFPEYKDRVLQEKASHRVQIRLLSLALTLCKYSEIIEMASQMEANGDTAKSKMSPSHYSTFCEVYGAGLTGEGRFQEGLKYSEETHKQQRYILYHKDFDPVPKDTPLEFDQNTIAPFVDDYVEEMLYDIEPVLSLVIAYYGLGRKEDAREVLRDFPDIINVIYDKTIAIVDAKFGLGVNRDLVNARVYTIVKALAERGGDEELAKEVEGKCHNPATLSEILAEDDDSSDN